MFAEGLAIGATASRVFRPSPELMKTVSAPGGIGAPVNIRTACPCLIAPAAVAPA